MSKSELAGLKQAALKAMRGSAIGHSSVYRRVYQFTCRRRKYVVKVDRRKPGSGELGFCRTELKVWREFRNQPQGKVLAPILAHGTLQDGRGWIVMPKLQVLASVLRHRISTTPYDEQEARTWYLREKIAPKVKQFLPGLRSACNGLACSDLGDDMHYNNWAMDNRGKWFLIDYAGYGMVTS